MKSLMRSLDAYNPRRDVKIKSKDKTLDNTRELFNGKNEVIYAFESGISPFSKGFQNNLRD